MKPTTKKLLLSSLCEALKKDTRLMPGATADLLRDSGAELATGTYAEGSAAVLSNMDYWGARLGA